MAEKKIGALTYRATALPAMQTVTMGRRIANIVGPAMPALADALAKSDGTNRDTAALAAFGEMAGKLDERFDGLVRELAEMAEVNWNSVWTPVSVEMDEFVPDAGTLMLLAFFVLEVNFKSFFSGPLAKLLASRTPG